MSQDVSTAGRLDKHQLASAAEAIRSQRPIQDFAPELGFADASGLLRAIADSMRLKLADLTDIEIDEQILEGFPVRLIHRYEVFPIAKKSDALVVALSNPFDFQAIDALSAATGQIIQPVVSDPEQVRDLIKRFLGVGAETIDGLLALQKDEDLGELNSLTGQDLEDAEVAQQASVVRLVNEILSEAIEARASDIHIEAQEKGIKIRYRIDGVLQRQPAPPEMNQFRSAIVSRLKIMARLNIAEKRVPQDGRIKIRVKGREVDIRVSIIPMLHGEGIVMRVLDKENLRFSLADIGMPDDVYQRFQKLIRLPHGIILVTGPTGSGKTTTLYSALSEIQDEETKIITTEDPIEYQLEGINQIQVHKKVGLTFAASLRSILRHDPDVVLVGEIRDLETAENATQASLTGHLVFSTLHTNDSAGAFMRLCDMGVEPFLVSSTVEGVMAQRLVRKLCPDCREPDLCRQADLPDDFPYEQAKENGTVVYRPVGCSACRGSGYRGRMGLYELLVANDEIRDLATNQAASNEIKKAAVRGGMKTLRHDGWNKVMQGVTSIDEVLRVTKADA
ncbi:type II secretion system ATPase GspE [Crateriforma conspicua]|uniref:type II secretion system ATPase GspE n=1 Tax=Crateriforma conspicua TaxID=2527996 RepID=UPI0011A3F3C5|nr:type II secretion system ATPase GspE [Crateriforma conspicua]